MQKKQNNKEIKKSMFDSQEEIFDTAITEKDLQINLQKEVKEKSIEKPNKKRKIQETSKETINIYEIFNCKPEDALEKLRTLQKRSLEQKVPEVIGSIMSPFYEQRMNRETPEGLITYMLNSIEKKELIVPHSIKKYYLEKIISGINEENPFKGNYYPTYMNQTAFNHYVFEIVGKTPNIITWEDLEKKVKEIWDSEEAKKYKTVRGWIDSLKSFGSVEVIKGEFEDYWKNVLGIWKDKSYSEK